MLERGEGGAYNRSGYSKQMQQCSWGGGGGRGGGSALWGTGVLSGHCCTMSEGCLGPFHPHKQQQEQQELVLPPYCSPQCVWFSVCVLCVQYNNIAGGEKGGGNAVLHIHPSPAPEEM